MVRPSAVIHAAHQAETHRDLQAVCTDEIPPLAPLLVELQLKTIADRVLFGCQGAAQDGGYVKVDSEDKHHLDTQDFD